LLLSAAPGGIQIREYEDVLSSDLLLFAGGQFFHKSQNLDSCKQKRTLPVI